MIEISGLTKTFGRVRAVDDLTFTVQPGRVTGFLGPNGAGKTTTLRCLLGLVRPTAGTATFGGQNYQDLARPVEKVGAALEATNFHPGRSGRNHLRTLCLASGLPTDRADEALERVGLGDAADRRTFSYSLGMRQRLQLASVMLGDPEVLVFDEPANGLDPEGIAWLRQLLRHYAGLGRTVLVSSHVLAEVEQTVDDVVIISQGRLVRAGPLAELVSQGHHVIVRTPDVERLTVALRGQAEVSAEITPPDQLLIHGLSTAEVGRLALNSGVELHELREAATDLEQVFLGLIDDSSNVATP